MFVLVLDFFFKFTVVAMQRHIVGHPVALFAATFINVITSG